MSSTEGIVFRIEKFSLHNGPGIRTTLFLKGCPLSCAWCGNPESQSPDPELLYNRELCLPECRECIAACPENALAKPQTPAASNGGGRSPAADWKAHDAADAGTVAAVLDRSRCTSCGACVPHCPTGALSIAGERMTAEEAARRLLADRPFFEASGGGITLSGGEPLAQPAFVRELLERVGAEGVHRALDTCGDGDCGEFARLLSLCDLVLFDFKLADPELHRRWTGRDNLRILANLHLAAERKPEALRVRVPLIPGVNDTPEAIPAIADELRQAGIGSLDLLPYHRLGAGKYPMLGREYGMPGVPVPGAGPIRDAAARFAACGIETTIIG